MVASSTFVPALLPVADVQPGHHWECGSHCSSISSPLLCGFSVRSGSALQPFELSLARHAARGERHHLESRLGNRLVTLATDAVPAGVEVFEGLTHFLALSG